MVTQFGKFLRILRINNGDNAAKMAKKLHISTSYLSAIENGNRAIPPYMEDLINKAYTLSSKETYDLRTSIIASSNYIYFDTSKCSPVKNKLIYALYKDEIDETLIDSIVLQIGRLPINK